MEAGLNNKLINLIVVLARQCYYYYFFKFRVREQTPYLHYYILIRTLPASFVLSSGLLRRGVVLVFQMTITWPKKKEIRLNQLYLQTRISKTPFSLG